MTTELTCAGVQALIDTCLAKGASKDQKRAVAEEIIDKLLLGGLAKVVRLRNQQVAIHPENRYRIGVDPCEAHALLGRIVCDGYSEHELGARWAFAPAPAGSGESHQQEIFNRNLVDKSDGMLPRHVWTDVLALAVSSSHTVTAFKCAVAAVRSEEDFLCDDGRVSLLKVKQMCPSITPVLDNGMAWTIVDSEAASRIPLLPSFLGDAGNKTHGAQRRITSLQALSKIHGQASQQEEVHREPNWGGIATELENRHQEFAGNGKHLCDFVEKWSGGKHAPMLAELDSYEKLLRVKRALPPKILGALSTVPITSHPEYISGVVKAMLSSPNAFSTGGVSTLIGPTEVEQMKHAKKGMCVRAADIMRTSGRWLQSLGLDEVVCTRLYGDFQATLVMFVHNRNCKGRASFKTSDAACGAFVEDVLTKCPAGADLTNLPWPRVARDGDASSSHATARSMREFTDGGVHTKELQKVGIVAGVTVARKSDEDALKRACADALPTKRF